MTDSPTDRSSGEIPAVLAELIDAYREIMAPENPLNATAANRELVVSQCLQSIDDYAKDLIRQRDSLMRRADEGDGRDVLLALVDEIDADQAAIVTIRKDVIERYVATLAVATVD